MSDEKDDEKGRANFGDLEKKIVTDSINPGGKPDYLTQRNKRKRMRGLDNPSVVRANDSVPVMVPPSVLRGTVLGVVYLVVLAGFVWSAFNAVPAYMGANGQGSQGLAVVNSCTPINWKQPSAWLYPVRTCNGYFMLNSPADRAKGVVPLDNVNIVGAAQKGQEIDNAVLAPNGTVYVKGWSGWIWWTVVAVVLLLAFGFLTFRRHGVVPGIRAVLAARAATRARVHAQEQARARARELRKKRAAEAREKAAGKSGKSETAKKPATAKKAEPKTTAAKPRKKAVKNPAHVATVAGTTRKVEPEDAEEDAEQAD